MEFLPFKKTKSLHSSKSTILQIFGVFIFSVLFIKLVFDKSVTTRVINQKYVTSTFDNPADLGNMLFRFASLYGIGKKLGRLPYVNGSIEIQLAGLTELSESFPLLHEIVQIKVPYESLITAVNFTDHCCIYESEENLKKYNCAKYLKLSANYLQSYKFFHDYRADIGVLMECSNKIKQKSKTLAKTFWKSKDSDNLHKMCVHVRRGDFVPNWPLETRMDFTLPAIKYIYNDLKKQNVKNISLLFLGNDKTFINEFKDVLNLDFQSINNLFGFNTSRTFDMCFGIQNCDSLLISASASTYAWWIGYLMKSLGPVYYNAVITKSGMHAKDVYDYDLFLPHWKKLLLHNDTISIVTKWTVERNKTK